MKIIADFHIHSRYSRATSRDMEIETLAQWARMKGINLLGTGDFTHPIYLSQLKAKLRESGPGLYSGKRDDGKISFLLSAEVCNIFNANGKLKKIHTIIFAPSFEVVDRINSILKGRGNLHSDGRPIFSFPVKDLVKIVLDISSDCLLVPAHAWTPWFSLFGANSGFDTIEDCFEEEYTNIYAIETGLSSDPAMNWRLSCLDKITLLSNSDAHSPSRIGREANVFNASLDYYQILEVIKSKDRKRFLFTIEFFPEEGKYHFDGHRNCGMNLSPKESRDYKGMCPKCKGRITVGVMHRVEDLSDRPEGYKPLDAIGVRHLIPLSEIIAQALGIGKETQGVLKEYEKTVQKGGDELSILLDHSLDDLKSVLHPKIWEGIKRVREGRVKIIPGFDGEYGKINIFEEEKEIIKKDEVPKKESFEQMSLF